MVNVKIWPVMGVAIVTCKCVYFICFMKEKKRKIKAHQWSLNLLSWCLSHWSMIMIYFVLWTVFKYLFSVMLSSFNNGDVFKAQCLCYDFTTMDHVLFPTVYLLFFCLFLYILAVPEWQNILNVSPYVAVAQETEIIAMIIIIIKKRIWQNDTGTIHLVV